jgi:hypothetical protein
MKDLGKDARARKGINRDSKTEADPTSPLHSNLYKTITS